MTSPMRSIPSLRHCMGLLLAAACLAACGGGGDGGSDATTVPTAPSGGAYLAVTDVQQILAQGVNEASARNSPATFAVVDRVGNVLAVYRMPGANTTVNISSGFGKGGLDGLDGVVPDTLAAITKAITGAYLSSEGNAFSTRTASQIIQENFDPLQTNQPSGPLFGVQFSQLACSDLMHRAADGSLGPKISPLGLAADPGGLPLYKNGQLVGSIGVVANDLYTLDRNIGADTPSAAEAIALASSTGFAAPSAVQADRITVDGLSLIYVNDETLLSNPATADAGTLDATRYVAVPGYFSGMPADGVAFGTSASGYAADSGSFASLSGWILLNEQGGNRYPASDASSPAPAAGGMGSAEVLLLLQQALGVANDARAQIRMPLGSAAQVTITVVDLSGQVLGLVRSPDAPVFGTDVALQKARTAAFFSSQPAAGLLAAAAPANYLAGQGGTAASSPIAAYLTASQEFFGDATIFTGNVAFSTRAIANISRPMFPDGIAGMPPGPLSKPMGVWSPFNDGLQLDLVYNQLANSLAGNLSEGCDDMPQLANGIQIFAGGMPIYRGSQLIGAIGVSGDGVDQDDMVAFLGLARAGQAQSAAGQSNPIGNAPAAIRADNLTPQGTRLLYVQCPVSPFNNSTDQNACAGL